MIQINFPNIISFVRLAVSPFFYILFLSQNTELVNLSCWLFILSAITDTIDGWAARRFGIVTRWGEFLDPLADKALTTFAFIAFVQKDIIPLWMVIIIIIRDVISTTLRIVGLVKKSPLQTSLSAKVKTTFQMLFISYILILVYLKNNFAPTILNPTTIDNLIYSAFTYLLALIITTMALYSLTGYVIRYRNFIKKVKKVEKIEKKLH